MKFEINILAGATLFLACSQFAAFSADQKPAFSDDKDKMSYAIGMSIGNNIKRGNVDLNLDVLSSAIHDVVDAKPTKLTDQEAQEAIRTYQGKAMAKREEQRKALAEKNKLEGEKFLQEMKSKPGVKTHQVKLPDGTTAEFEYKVIKEGSGATPKSNDVVTVNYRGTLINGKEFDSSAKTGKPAQFPVNRVVRGWTEALQMMKEGSKWELYLPSSLAYGDFGSGPNIEPGSTLIFEIELVSVEAPPPPPPAPQPLTSDIIKVPSADELKKGAKIEVLKADEVERMLKTNQPAAKSNTPATK